MLWFLVRPVLFVLSPERAHGLAMFLLRWLTAVPGVRGLMRALYVPTDERLRVRAFDLWFPSPIGLAAGFDKDAEAYESLGALGFGFVEVGTVTAFAQPGNPRPRLFRLPEDQALINRMGFNNRGSVQAARRLRRSRRTIVGVNIGKSKQTPPDGAVADYVASAERLAPFADYLVVNVSSPNTPGLRDLQAVSSLEPLLQAVRAGCDRVSPERRVPLLVKIAPDLADEDVDAVADLALRVGLDGIIATNTTVARNGLGTEGAVVDACGPGGLSGPVLAGRATEVLARLRARAGDGLVLIAAGGIATADDAWARLEAGATLVQLYTGFVYGGPATPRRIARGLARRAREAGFGSVNDATGRAGGPPQVRSCSPRR